MGYSDFFNEPEGLLPFMSAGDEEFMEPPPPFQHEYDNGKHPRQPNGATQVIAQPPSGQRVREHP
ncbi:hypothetical protein GY45DRAFT_1324633 [Cubamyces sp. BRFM 1775]|nr:hypothetical protein GY45DRAFT_1324633 [Cubamyces sp. BRFM 1775]